MLGHQRIQDPSCVLTSWVGGELDHTQELNYPPILRAILETGYTGYVAQEFIPAWPDKLGALRHGVRVCDV